MSENQIISQAQVASVGIGCEDDDFNPRAYTALYSDVPADLDSARSHYLSHGRAEGRYPNEEAFEVDRQLLLDAGLFDETFYRAAAGLDIAGDAIRHYLVWGWRAGTNPAPAFESFFLKPYYRTAQFYGPPAATYALFRAAGWAVYASRAEAEAVAKVVRASELFDEKVYRTQLGQNCRHLDPVLHYVLVGERLGMPPSSRFDPFYYLEVRPDLGEARICLLTHYLQYGEHEGYRPRPVANDLAIDAALFAPEKETIILVSHEASRTGAPILALNVGQHLRNKYNVVTILMRGGSLIGSFEEISASLICIDHKHCNQIELKHIVEAICRKITVRYAIVNSIASWEILSALGRAFVPTVTLIHEFSSYSHPRDKIREALGHAMELVFSAELTANSFRKDHPALCHRQLHVLTQGRCRLPLAGSDTMVERQRLTDAMRPAGSQNIFVVLGIGTRELRKGADIFVATAATAVRLAHKRRLLFVWIGGSSSDNQTEYHSLLKEQIARSGLNGQLVWFNDVTDVEPAYAMADVFYLSSRLDPFPNVTIDAAMLGKPVICFEGASGFAEMLRRDRSAGLTVVPYLDVDAAARQIIKLAESDSLLGQVGAATSALARATFDMDRYVARIDEIGTEAIASMQRYRADFETLLNELFFEPFSDDVAISQKDRIYRFMAHWRATLTAARNTPHIDLRRPCPGFHPITYAHHHSELMQTGVNPLADYVRRGRPQGPWSHPVINPCEGKLPRAGSSKLRVAIQAHFYYPELIDDFLSKLSVNRSHCDLLLSTGDETKVAALRSATEKFSKGRVEIRIVPNRGRDLGPLLTLYGDEILRSYDVVGHLHGKRSPHAAGLVGENWREFLWQHLLGDLYPMMDVVLSHFAADERLGLVFPEEFDLCDWDDNREIADDLAARAELVQPLPPFFDFPVGSMFWARPRALAPLINLKLDWGDYPEEPVPIDGTILHALERLVPFAASKEGFSFATSYIPGVTR